MLKPIELIIEDVKTGNIHQLHQENAEFDVTFDIVSGNMVLKQDFSDPETCPPEQFMTAVFFNQSNTTFINLEGLAENSLLLTFKLNSAPPLNMKPNAKAEKKQLGTPGQLRVKYRNHAFNTKKTPFYKAFTDWDGEEKILQLLLPESRIKSWKTVALVLLTFREINITIWHRLVNDGRLRDLAGFDWARVREKVQEVNPTDIRPKTNLNLPMREQLAKKEKEKVAIEARLIALQTGMGLKALSGHGPTDNGPFLARQVLHSGDLGFKG